MYRVEFTQTADKQFAKLDKYTQGMLRTFINKNLEGTDNPRQIGKPLKGNLRGLWRYEAGKYRLLCNIEDGVLQILVVKVGHRRNVYEKSP
jgi:mRNA interferase RelE/StbE